MSTVAGQYVIHFPDDYDTQREHETPSRGYLSHVVVQREDGSRYQMFFIDPIRLEQELADETQAGRPFFAEPNMIVLPEVTTASVRKAIEGLVQQGFFELWKPLEAH